MEGLEARLAEYLAHRMEWADELVVENLARIHGGSSQETFRFDAYWTQDGAKHRGNFILRRAPVKGLVNAEHDLEFTVYTALARSGIPIPNAHFLELDPRWLERPFFIMERAPGKPGHFFGSDDPYDGRSEEVGTAFWTHLGKLAAQDHRALGLENLRGGDEEGPAWSRELDHWEAILDQGEAVVEPITRGAIRWMRRNPPPAPAKPAIVHGDYRSGNFLFVPDGSISATLDWEMCHVGDPLEDIAWAVDPMWSMERYFPFDRGLVLWEKASGLTIDLDALEWWRLFAAVKASGIWTTAEKSFEEGDNSEMIIALTAMRASHFHRKVILDHMERCGAMG